MNGQLPASLRDPDNYDETELVRYVLGQLGKDVEKADKATLGQALMETIQEVRNPPHPIILEQTGAKVPIPDAHFSNDIIARLTREQEQVKFALHEANMALAIAEAQAPRPPLTQARINEVSADLARAMGCGVEDTQTDAALSHEEELARRMGCPPAPRRDTWIP